jgi:hypothetical protein
MIYKLRKVPNALIDKFLKLLDTPFDKNLKPPP